MTAPISTSNFDYSQYNAGTSYTNTPVATAAAPVMPTDSYGQVQSFNPGGQQADTLGVWGDMGAAPAQFHVEQIIKSSASPKAVMTKDGPATVYSYAPSVASRLDYSRLANFMDNEGLQSLQSFA